MCNFSLESLGSEQIADIYLITCLLNMSMNHGTHLVQANSTLGIVVASVTYIPLPSYGEKAMTSEGMTSFKETGLAAYEQSQPISQRLAKKWSCDP